VEANLLNSNVLDVAIGIVFTYLLLSVACTIINETVASLLASRGKNLVSGIRSMFSGAVDSNGNLLADRIYSHGLIRGLFRDPSGSREGAPPRADDGSLVQKVSNLSIVAERSKLFLADLPSYIPSRMFALALLDIVSPAKATVPRTLEDIRSGIASLPASDARTALLGLLSSGATKVDDAQRNIENWYNDAMDRASGWYRRKTQKTLLIIGFVLAVSLNADTIQLVKTLWTEPAVRDAQQVAARRYLGHQNSDQGANPGGANLTQVAKELGDLRDNFPMPLGWNFSSQEPITLKGTLIKLIGLILTTLALSLGAPFWFDLLNKFMVVRSTVKPREKSEIELSKDA
jgi:hypothetical protein